MSDQKLAVLILSCDKYADMWPFFLRQFGLFFPINDHTIYLGSNNIPCEDPRVVSILSGDDSDWSTSFKRILAQIEEPKIFVILEDLLLAGPIDHQGFKTALSYLIEKNALHIKYWAIPKHLNLGRTESPRIGIYPRDAPYRATVCGFWDRAYLMNLLIEGENPWNFEIMGSYRTSYSDGFYGLMRPLGEYRNMIEKGCWIPQSVEWAQQVEILLPLDKRPLLKGGNKVASRLKMIYFDLVLLISWRWRVKLMNMLRRAFISY